MQRNPTIIVSSVLGFVPQPNLRLYTFMDTMQTIAIPSDILK
ncbi:hypothetical protein [Aerosakkonema funiforme]